MKQLSVMKDLSEIIPYNVGDMHLYASKKGFDAYNNKTIYHWHEDIELTLINEGRMDYFINGERITLGEGDLLVTNSRQMHYGDARKYLDPEKDKQCLYSCILFRPELIQTSSSLFDQYVRPIIHNEDIPYVLYRKGENPDAVDLLCLAVESAVRQEAGYEMETLAVLQQFWVKVYRSLERRLETKQESSADDTLHKKMVAYVYEYYAQPLTLEDIAAAANISRTKCCQIFKEKLDQSPVDFLNHYRLTVARYYVEKSDMKFAEIAERCGFRGQSYFTQRFRETYGVSPRELRKQEREGAKA